MRTLRELLYNSAKYSDGQHVVLRISHTDETINFIVEDTGKGISEADNATMRVAVDGRRIRVSGVSSEVRLYDAAGRQIGTRFARHGNADFVAPATGVYLLQSGTSKAQKVVVF